MAVAPRSEFGNFLRSRRERLSPEAAGLSSLRRRRTPGLRREEVAELAGIGIDWYIRLEQGRTVSPSPATIDRAGAAPCISAEPSMLTCMALAQTVERRAFSRETVPEPIRRLVEGLDQPAYVTGRRWDVLAWNRAAIDVFTDFGLVAEEDRNILLYVSDRSERPGAVSGRRWVEEARRMVAQFRATHDLWAGDPAFADLLDRLATELPGVPGVVGDARRPHRRHRRSKTADPSRNGAIVLQLRDVSVQRRPGLKLVIYTPFETA